MKMNHPDYLITNNAARHLAACSGIALIAIGVAFLQPFSFSDNSYADSDSTPLDTSVTLEPTLSISTDVDAVNLTVNPSDYESLVTGDVNVNVSTNNATGYTLSVASSSSTTALVNKDNSNITIPTLDNETTATAWEADSSLNNKWGFTHDNTALLTTGTYLPIVATNENNETTIKTTDSANNSSNTKLTFATKIDSSQASGEYDNTIIISAVANEVPKIYMQNMTASDCAALPVYDPTNADATTFTVVDIRDNQEYRIRRLYMSADKTDSPSTTACWMVDNLKLSYDTLPENSKTLTSSDTNLDADFKMESQNTGTWCTANSTECDDTINHIATPDPYGVLYNWYTATAGTGKYTTPASTDVPASICPGKGANTATWHLPTGGSTSANSEWYKLFGAYKFDYGWSTISGSGNSNVNNLSTTIGPDFIYSGRRSGATTSSQSASASSSAYGFWWSSTAGNASSAYGGYVHGDGRIYGGTSNYSKYNGYAVRCALSAS